MSKRGISVLKKTISISEISVLVLAIFAFSFIINSSNVSAGGQGPPSYLAGPSDSNSAPASKPSTETTAGGATGIFGFFEDLYAGKLFSSETTGAGGQAVVTESFLGHLVSGLAWGATVGVIAYFIADLVGASEAQSRAIGYSLGIGTAVGQFAYLETVRSGGMFFTSGSSTILGLPASQGAFVLGAGVAIVAFVLLYKEEKQEIVNLQCLPWEAPIGGSSCEKCNQDPLRPCSEYRCKALGQACELVNQGSSQERCVWVSRNDVNSPVIKPFTDVLTKEHTYTDIRGRPPSRGTQVTFDGSGDGCVKPFTALQFGLSTNEPSQCKLDIVGNKSFDEMRFYFGESNLFSYNHTQKLRLPSPDSIKAEAPELPSEGNYNFYVRCRDANGNVNEDEFVFNICVDKSPDTTPPVIESTSIASGSPISFGTTVLNVTFNVNEPSQCKWATQDKSYDLMENDLSCSTRVYEQNALQLYPCTAQLTGLKDRATNLFYVRCKDQPSKPENERITNQESYVFSLIGTQTLSILSYGPNSTFTGSTDIVSVNLTVRTDDGAEEGKARCYFSSTGQEGSYIAMFETDSYTHKQILNLGEGSYNYNFRCVDAGGNAASANTSFNVLTDRQAPSVTRVYKDSDALKVITNEDATCKYSVSSCNFVFDEGISFILLNSQEKKIHATPWKAQQSYYVKCRDSYGNEPSPNSCSIVASASNLN